MAVRSIDPRALQADRDQLWAEAVAAYKAGEHWWLKDPALIAEQQEAAEAVREVDAWQGVVEAYLIKRGDPEFVATDDLLIEALELKIDRWGKPEQMRLGRVMTALGWVKYRKLGVGVRRRGYRKG